MGLYSDYFKDYGTGDNHKLWFRKIGNMVDIQGVVTPTQDINGGQSYTETSVIFKLSTDYAPRVDVHLLCQGSGNGIWLCTVGKDGTVCMTRFRYNGDANYATVNAGNYMPLHVTFLIAD